MKLIDRIGTNLNLLDFLALFFDQWLFRFSFASPFLPLPSLSSVCMALGLFEGSRKKKETVHFVYTPSKEL
jgi:hypothetical protein